MCIPKYLFSHYFIFINKILFSPGNKSQYYNIHTYLYMQIYVAT